MGTHLLASLGSKGKNGNSLACLELHKVDIEQEYLGCELVRDRKTRTGHLVQAGYAERVLRAFDMDYGTHLFKFRQQHDGDFNHEAARHYFNQTDAPMSQISLKIQVVKATISDTAAHYEALDQDAKRQLQQHNVTVYIKKANQILLEALRKHFLLKKQHALTDQMQKALDNPQVRKTVAMDFSDWQPAWTDWQVCQLPAAHVWADMLDVFQGRERSKLAIITITMKIPNIMCMLL
jgi:hypothetical protein